MALDSNLLVGLVLPLSPQSSHSYPLDCFATAEYKVSL